jgi:hypothetical protein
MQSRSGNGRKAFFSLSDVKASSVGRVHNEVAQYISHNKYDEEVQVIQ